MFEAQPVGLDYFRNNWDAKDKPLSHLWWFIMEYLLSAGGLLSLINVCLSFPDPFNNSLLFYSLHVLLSDILSIQKYNLLCQSSLHLYARNQHNHPLTELLRINGTLPSSVVYPLGYSLALSLKICIPKPLISEPHMKTLCSCFLNEHP